MAELISRDDLLKAIYAKVAENPNERCSQLLEAILNAPTEDVVEVIHGEWKQTTEPLGAHDVDCVMCSACGDSWILDEEFDFDTVVDFWHYCPTCGARMKGGDKQ